MKKPPILAMAIALVGGLLVGLLVLRANAAPELTSERLAAARARWEAEGPSSYTLVLQMRGAVQDRRTIEVRDGQVVDMKTGGRPAREGSWSYWSVDGLFDFLDTELRNAAHPPPELGIDDPSQIVLRARFDRRWGYPAYFLRHLLGRQQSTEWEVVDFQVHSDS